MVFYYRKLLCVKLGVCQIRTCVFDTCDTVSHCPYCESIIQIVVCIFLVFLVFVRFYHKHQGTKCSKRYLHKSVIGQFYFSYNPTTSEVTVNRLYTQCSVKTRTRGAMAMAGQRAGAITLAMVTVYAVGVQPCVACVQQVFVLRVE